MAAEIRMSLLDEIPKRQANPPGLKNLPQEGTLKTSAVGNAKAKPRHAPMAGEAPEWRQQKEG
jgi:hypothetical protein